MYTQTKTQTKLSIDFSRLSTYQTQLSAVLQESGFARIPQKLQKKSLQIFSQKLEVLLTDIENIVDAGVEELSEEKVDTIVNRIEFAQKFFFEEAFQKSVDTYLDLYKMSDVEEEVHAYLQLERFFAELQLQIHSHLKDINYAQFIGKLNTIL